MAAAAATAAVTRGPVLQGEKRRTSVRRRRPSLLLIPTAVLRLYLVRLLYPPVSPLALSRSSPPPPPSVVSSFSASCLFLPFSSCRLASSASLFRASLNDDASLSLSRSSLLTLLSSCRRSSSRSVSVSPATRYFARSFSNKLSLLRAIAMMPRDRGTLRAFYARATTQKTGAKSPIRTFIELRYGAYRPTSASSLSVPAALSREHRISLLAMAMETRGCAGCTLPITRRDQKRKALLGD